MNKVTVKNILVFFAIVAITVVTLIPSYAFPMARQAERNARRDVSSDMRGNDDMMPDGNVTEGDTDDGIIGNDDNATTTADDAATTTTPERTTTTPTTSANPPTTTSPITSMLDEVMDGDGGNGNGFVVWGIIAAIVIAGAVVAVVMMTGRSRRR